MAETPLIYTGVHHPQLAGWLERAMLSANVLERRVADFSARRWILDSGAFGRITTGRGHMPVARYARMAERWAACGTLEAVVCQDLMCEPEVLALTGLTVREHQDRTTRAFLELREVSPVPVMPVLQGYLPEEYARHVRELSPELPEQQWTGVGSLCRRQGSPARISAVLTAVLTERPDLRLHGFGVKTTALRDASVAQRLCSVDSMAWSYRARREDWQHDPGARNSPQAALRWARETQGITPKDSQGALGI